MTDSWILEGLQADGTVVTETTDGLFKGPTLTGNSLAIQHVRDAGGSFAYAYTS